MLKRFHRRQQSRQVTLFLHVNDDLGIGDANITAITEKAFKQRQRRVL